MNDYEDTMINCLMIGFIIGFILAAIGTDFVCLLSWEHKLSNAGLAEYNKQTGE